MELSTIQELRNFGGLPDSAKIPDEKITPHLEAASRMLTSWIGDYSDAADEKAECCKEAECCICMSMLMPVLNTFYTADLASVQKNVGEMDFIFHSPGDTRQVQQDWMERARKAVAVYISEYRTIEQSEWVAI